jgi:hypothetical protein
MLPLEIETSKKDRNYKGEFDLWPSQGKIKYPTFFFKVTIVVTKPTFYVCNHLGRLSYMFFTFNECPFHIEGINLFDVTHLGMIRIFFVWSDPGIRRF